MLNSQEMCQKKEINYFKHRINHSQTLKITGVKVLIHTFPTKPDLGKNIYQRGSQVILKSVKSKIFCDRKIFGKFSIFRFSKIFIENLDFFDFPIFENFSILRFFKISNGFSMKNFDRFFSKPSTSKWVSSLANKYFDLNPVALEKYGLVLSPLSFRRPGSNKFDV